MVTDDVEADTRFAVAGRGSDRGSRCPGFHGCQLPYEQRQYDVRVDLRRERCAIKTPQVCLRNSQATRFNLTLYTRFATYTVRAISAVWLGLPGLQVQCTPRAKKLTITSSVLTLSALPIVPQHALLYGMSNGRMQELPHGQLDDLLRLNTIPRLRKPSCSKTPRWSSLIVVRLSNGGAVSHGKSGSRYLDRRAWRSTLDAQWTTCLGRRFRPRDRKLKLKVASHLWTGG